MTKKIHASWLLLALAPAFSAFANGCSDAPISMGNTGGSGGSAGTGVAGTAGSGGACPISACGPELGIPNVQCSDGSIGGPTGRCIADPNGTCGWEIHLCPPPGSGGASGTGGSTSTGGTGGAPACMVDGDCIVPQLCKQCPNGGASCATAACVNGQCETSFPPCSGGTGGSAGASGTGGTGAGGGGGGVTCGGIVCPANETCCGSPACGTCVPLGAGACIVPNCGSGGAAGAAGAGGSGGGVTCGGKVCPSNEVCCGGSPCGVCVPPNAATCIVPGCGSGGASGSGGSAGAAGSAGTGGADCTTLLNDVESKLATAQVCNNQSATPVAQCQGIVDGTCCSELVESATSSATTAYLNALNTYKANCKYVCPAIACKLPQPGNCVQTSGASTGHCQ